MDDIRATGPTADVDELEDLEPEPSDAENIKGGAAADDADPTGHGGKGGSS